MSTQSKIHLWRFLDEVIFWKSCKAKEVPLHRKTCVWQYIKILGNGISLKTFGFN